MWYLVYGCDVAKGFMMLDFVGGYSRKYGDYFTLIWYWSTDSKLKTNQMKSLPTRIKKKNWVQFGDMYFRMAISSDDILDECWVTVFG